MNPFGKVITALATPFYKGKVDKISFIKLLRWQEKNGVKTLVLNGTTGESPNLSDKEVKTLFLLIKAHTPKMKIILGVGGNNTSKVKKTLTHFEKLKPDAILSVVPYYNLPPQRGLIKHFLSLADVSSLPIILYNVPSRTAGLGLSLNSIKELSLHPNIIGIKEATGHIAFAKKIVNGTKKNFLFFSGDDASFLKTISNGGDGVVSVLSNLVGKSLISLSKQTLHSPKKTWSQYNKHYGELIKHVYSETNPIGVKMALYLMGIFKSPEMRSPLVEMSEPNKKKLKEALENLNFGTPFFSF